MYSYDFENPPTPLASAESATKEEILHRVLDEGLALEILRRWGLGHRAREIAAMLALSIGSVYNVITGRTWRQLSRAGLRRWHPSAHV
jgi:DNA-directed RNA polymerase specialized sigma24 family protein